MHLTPSSDLLHSATDLSNHLACAHLSVLNRSLARGAIGAPRTYDDPAAEVLQKRGLEHEAAFLDRLGAEGKGVVEIADPELAIPERWTRRAADTLDAMGSRADVIYQGCLFDGTWVGLPDFLVRVERPSDLGAWSYEVADAKLAREAKGGAVLQISLYSDLLGRAQGAAPEFMGIALGGPEGHTERFRVADFAAYYRSARGRFEALMEGPAEPLAEAVDPVEFCQLCRWKQRCDKERRDVDHLSLVAGIARRQRRALVDIDIDTMAALGAILPPPETQLDGVSDASFERIREQARIQVEGREQDRHLHELLLPAVAGEGLAALPEPSPGDLFFDLEADPYAFTHGLEYLFGYCDATGEFTSLWALDPAAEKAAFERFIDLVIDRLERWPDLHVYHYAHYEQTALKRLMGRHGTREEELDRLLRARVFVDLHRVVRQGLRASVESYSIKKLEPFYGFGRDVDLRDANSALAHFEAWLELGGGSEGAGNLLERIEGYNRDDCVSTLRLRDWLEGLRPELEALVGTPVPRPTPEDGEAPENVAEELGEVAALVELLTADVSAETSERTPEHGRWLLAHLLSFHRREKKSMWWQFFARCAFGLEELIEDKATIGGLQYEGEVERIKQSTVHRYRFPRQDHDFGAGSSAHDPETEGGVGTVVAVDDVAGTIDLKRGNKNKAPHPLGLVPLENIRDDVLRESLRSVARGIAEHGIDGHHPFQATAELLVARPPRLTAGETGSLARPDESTVEAARRLVLELDRTVLPIQGPPGAGKTYTAARMILTLLAAGRRVGVTATGHKVISNLLDEVCRAAGEEGVRVAGIQKASASAGCRHGMIQLTGDNGAVLEALDSGEAQLAAGTSWLWSRPEMAGSVDVLFVDEAGQFSLANAVAVSPAAASLVLVGDPRQLEQPIQGTHPPGAGASAMEHLLAGEATMPPERGLFLADTWRLHPDICAFTSEIFYRGKLKPRAGLENQRVVGPAPVNGSGLRFVAVEHEGNTSESEAEVEAVAELVERALGRGGSPPASWIDKTGVESPLRLEHILIVAPYNLQVAALKEALPDGARVGTVDKFQGQEAPVVIYSMTSSSAEEAPRGMSFLYSPNRLNVATSRAKCLAIVVGSTALFTPECKSPDQMRLANASCRLRELAG
ncbi:MAG: TM0106 family RecB-like putative nuclease [Gemmatimonadota bacterium]